MRFLIDEPFDTWRDRSADTLRRYGSAGDSTCGVFDIPSYQPAGRYGDRLTVIASQGGGWDHVSVSVAGKPRKTPSWEDMVFMRRAFFSDDEWVIEFHPPPSKNISVHPGCLHLWRPNDGTAIPTPPSIMVG